MPSTRRIDPLAPKTTMLRKDDRLLASVLSDGAGTALDLPSTEPLVSLRDVVVRRESKTVLEIASLDIRRSEVLSVIGPNGAGKSTLLHVIALLLPPSAGKSPSAGSLLVREMTS